MFRLNSSVLWLQGSNSGEMVPTTLFTRQDLQILLSDKKRSEHYSLEKLKTLIFFFFIERRVSLYCPGRSRTPGLNRSSHLASDNAGITPCGLLPPCYYSVVDVFILQIFLLINGARNLEANLRASKIYFGNVYLTRNDILTILSVWLSGIKYVHIVVQPSAPSISRTLSSLTTETLSP